MQHPHHKIISAWIENPGAYECFFRSGAFSSWKLTNGPAWLVAYDYKIVKKEKILTEPSRRYITKLGDRYVPVHYTKKDELHPTNIHPEKTGFFVRWIDDDFITHEVETKDVEIVSLGTNSQSRES